MTIVSDLPNVEAAVNTVLIDAGLRAYSSLPKESPQFPLIVTHRGGGVPAVRERLDTARIQLTAWGDKDTDKTTLLELITEARALIYAAEGTTIDRFDCFITGVEDESVNLWLPDPPTDRPRYITTLRIYAHAAPGGSS